MGVKEEVARQFGSASTRRKLACNYHRTSTARHFHFSRIVRLWNTLPEIDLDISYAEINFFSLVLYLSF